MKDVSTSNGFLSWQAYMPANYLSHGLNQAKLLKTAITLIFDYTLFKGKQLRKSLKIIWTLDCALREPFHKSRSASVSTHLESIFVLSLLHLKIHTHKSNTFYAAGANMES